MAEAGTREVKDSERHRMAGYLDQIAACGPRAVGSRGEKSAIGRIARHFAATGLIVEKQEISVSRRPILLMTKCVPLVAAAVVVAAGWTHSSRPGLATVLLILLMAGLFFVPGWHFLTRRLFDSGRQISSANVIGRTRPDPSKRPSLVFLAHFDTKSQTFPIFVRVAALYVSISAVGFLSLLCVLAQAGVLAVGPTEVWGLAGIGAGSLLVQVFNRSGNRSPGALDNASGLALLMSLAGRLPAFLSEKANLLFVATGAEELGMGGSWRFVERFGSRLPRETTMCFNFDTLGCGRRLFLVGSKQPFEEVSRLLARLLERRGISARRMPMLPGAGMDHVPLADEGLWALSLTQAPGRASWWIHTREDRFERVDVSTLSEVSDAVCWTAEFVCETWRSGTGR